MLTSTEFRALFDDFLTDVEKFESKGNKAAGARARKTSMRIGKEMSAFRKESIEKDKAAD